ncbi:hypothetical protein VP01_4440g1 [Puccinia sorghi]|uniref:Uncharacterized protein n=1 Tax=Puccinia sorghi TaxID=27349 RepID=A0A0L6URF4_9BASI|nr:hypothetical protein VP01_4440g1 [Puccinia sorghi]
MNRLKALSHQVLFGFSFSIQHSFRHSSKSTEIVFGNTSSTRIKYQITLPFLTYLCMIDVVLQKLIILLNLISHLHSYLIVVKKFPLLYQDLVFQINIIGILLRLTVKLKDNNHHQTINSTNEDNAQLLWKAIMKRFISSEPSN